MASEIYEATKDQTFQDRIKWINNQRALGNDKFKVENYDEALDEYMKCLCALDFKTCTDKVEETQAKMADV